MSFSMLNAAASAVGICIASSTVVLSRGEWPNSPNKAWFENLQRPDNHLHPLYVADCLANRQIC